MFIRGTDNGVQNSLIFMHQSVFFKLVRSSYIHRTTLKGTFSLGKVVYCLDTSNLAWCIKQDFNILQNGGGGGGGAC